MSSMVQRCSGSIVNIQPINELQSDEVSHRRQSKHVEPYASFPTGTDEEGQTNLSGQHVLSQFDEILSVEWKMAADEHV